MNVDGQSSGSSSGECEVRGGGDERAELVGDADKKDLDTVLEESVGR